MKQAKQRKFRKRLTKMEQLASLIKEGWSWPVHLQVPPPNHWLATAEPTQVTSTKPVDVYCLDDGTGERMYLGTLEVHLPYTGDAFTLSLKEINHETN